MSTTEEQVWRILKPYILFVCIGWGLTIAVMVTKTALEDYDVHVAMKLKRAEIQAKVDALVNEEFSDYMDYRRIFPTNGRVKYDDEIYMVSDSAVLKVGFSIEWRERVQCDNNPYDKKAIWEFYAAGSVTQSDMLETRDYPEDGGKYLRGWPVREWRDPKKRYKGPSPILRYPTHDADCRVTSTMIQKHIDAQGNEHRKIQTMSSEHAEVRGY